MFSNSFFSAPSWGSGGGYAFAPRRTAYLDDLDSMWGAGPSFFTAAPSRFCASEQQPMAMFVRPTVQRKQPTQLPESLVRPSQQRTHPGYATEESNDSESESDDETLYSYRPSSYGMGLSRAAGRQQDQAHVHSPFGQHARPAVNRRNPNPVGTVPRTEALRAEKQDEPARNSRRMPPSCRQQTSNTRPTVRMVAPWAQQQRYPVLDDEYQVDSPASEDDVQPRPAGVQPDADHSDDPAASPANEAVTQQAAAAAASAEKTSAVTSDAESEVEEAAAPDRVAIMASFATILAITKEIESVQSEVEQFANSKQSKDYLRLEDTLTRILLRLDTVESHGDDKLRSIRRKAVRDAQSVLDTLEERVVQPNAATQAPVSTASSRNGDSAATFEPDSSNAGIVNQCISDDTMPAVAITEAASSEVMDEDSNADTDVDAGDETDEGEALCSADQALANPEAEPMSEDEDPKQ